MTLDQLRIFVTVAELQHVTRAAAKLHLTQSSVSAAISALEARHNVALFNRVGRRIELTKEGAIFFQPAKAVLAQAASAEKTLADLGGLTRGSIALFASQTIANFWLPFRLVRYNELHPGVALEVRIGNTAECASAILDGAAEIGLIEGGIDQPSLRADVVANDKLILVVGKRHKWVKKAPALPQEFRMTKWAIREPGSGTRSSFEQALTAQGLSLSDLPIALELPSNEALCAAVEAGEFATVVSETVAHAQIQAGNLCHVPVDMGTREFRLISHPARRLSHAAQAMATLLKTPPGS